jgi:hypothetical protein
MADERSDTRASRDGLGRNPADAKRKAAQAKATNKSSITKRQKFVPVTLAKVGVREKS